MDIRSIEKYTRPAPIHNPQCAGGTKIDSSRDSSIGVGDTFAESDSSSQECLSEQPDPGHSVVLNTKHVQSSIPPFQCNLCTEKFTHTNTLRSHLRTHGGEQPFVCNKCGRTFARQLERNRHEKIHSAERNFVCRGELSVQPARVWGCGRRFARADSLARHFFSNGRACIIPLLDMEVEKAGILTLPSVLLAQYPALKDFQIAHISDGQCVPSGEDSGMSLSSNDSGYETALHLGPSQPVRIPPFIQIEKHTEGPQVVLPYYNPLSPLESQAMPSPLLPNLQDPTDTFKLLPDRPETSDDPDNSLVKTLPNGDEPDYEGASGRKEQSDHQSDSQGNSDSEGRSNYKAYHLSNETIFGQKMACNEDGNAQLSDNSEGSFPPDESSSSSGSDNRYNDTSEGSVLNCFQKALISQLMDEICSSFFYQLSHRPRQRGQGGHGSQESSSCSTKQTITINNFIGESHSSRRKRSQKEDGDHEDDDSKNKRSRTQNSDDDHSTTVRYFACPFHKFDASTYGSGNADPRVGLKYRSCGPPGWPIIGKLK